MYLADRLNVYGLDVPGWDTSIAVIHALISAPDRKQAPVAKALAVHVSSDPRWQRLKHCPVCRLWFVDTAKNMTQARCSRACTDQWWNRARRRRAHVTTNVRDGRKGPHNRPAAPEVKKKTAR
jgi:hypothetical protein